MSRKPATARAERGYVHQPAGLARIESTSPASAAGPTITFGNSRCSRSMTASAMRAGMRTSAGSRARLTPNS